MDETLTFDRSQALQWDELLKAVERFGLSEREATLYLALLRRGRASARELARDARLDRVLSYRMLDGLTSRGVVEATAERPRRYVAVPPSVLFDRNLHGRRSELEEDERLAATLAARLPSLAPNATAGAPRFQVLRGTSTLHDQLRAMIGRAREEIDSMVPARAFRESGESELPQGLPRFLKRGGRFRLIVESDPRIRGLLQRIERVRSAYPGTELRHLSPQPSRLTLVDRSEVLVFLVAETRYSSLEEVAVWTDSPEFVQGQRLHFSAAWAAAGPSAWRAPPRSPGARRSAHANS